MTCVRVGWGSVAPLHNNKLQLCGVKTIGAIEIKKGVIPKEIKHCETYQDALKLKPLFWDVCVSNDQHLAVIQKIVKLDPEANILLEKPVCNFEQIGKLRTVLQGFRGKLVVNENYLSSQIVDRIKELVEKLQLTPKKVIVEMDKNRTQDFKKGRYIAKTVFGYEGTHMITILQNLGKDFAPKKDTKIEKKYEDIEIPERLEKQGLVDISYQVNGVSVNLFTSMSGVIKHRFKPHCPNVKSIDANDVKTRYRVAAIEGSDKKHKTFTVVGFYEPLQDFKRSIGAVAVLDEKGEVLQKYQPISDDTMGKHLERGVKYFQGLGKNPCTVEAGIETAELLHAIDS